MGKKIVSTPQIFRRLFKISLLILLRAPMIFCAPKILIRILNSEWFFGGWSVDNDDNGTQETTAG